MDTSPVSAHTDGVRLLVHLTPSAAKNQFIRIDQNANSTVRLRTTVTAAPEQGKANKALIKLLSKKLRLPKSAIQIIAGQHAREKTLVICGETSTLLTQIAAVFVSEKLIEP
jgi:uncharacterized protein (TIGR00251 family)